MLRREWIVKHVNQKQKTAIYRMIARVVCDFVKCHISFCTKKVADAEVKAAGGPASRWALASTLLHTSSWRVFVYSTVF
jgi:hypothetical protein